MMEEMSTATGDEIYFLPLTYVSLELGSIDNSEYNASLFTSYPVDQRKLNTTRKIKIKHDQLDGL